MGSFVLHPGFWRRGICIVLAVTMAVGPSLNVMAQATAPRSPAPPAAALAKESAGAIIDPRYVTPYASAIVVFRPAQIMKSPSSELLPVEVVTAAGLKYLGVDPANIDELVGFVDLSNPTAPAYGLTFNFITPIRSGDIPEQLRAHTRRDELDGRAYLKSQQPMLPSFYAPNNRTLLIAPDEVIRHLVPAPAAPASGPVVDRVRKVAGGNDLYVAVNVTSLRPIVQMGLAQSREPIPPEAKPFLDALNLLDAAELTVNLSKPGTTSLVAHANDETAAQQIEKILADAADQYREKMKASIAAQKNSQDPIERATAQYLERVSGPMTQPFMPQRKGADLTFFRSDGSGSQQQQQLVSVAVIGILVALLLPAIQAAREAARRNASMNNMKQMIIGLMNYHDTRGRFPGHAIYSADGKPLLSWRVQILPFIEEQALYKEFHLDEPWDSEHNRALIARMPKTFENPNLREAAGKTNYLAVVGKPCVFDGTDKGKRLQEVADGTSNTIVLVEANADQAVEWTKPDDLKYDAKNPTAGLGKMRPGGWLATFADAHIQFISNAVDKNLLNALFTCAGGEPVRAGQDF